MPFLSSITCTHALTQAAFLHSQEPMEHSK